MPKPTTAVDPTVKPEPNLERYAIHKLGPCQGAEKWLGLSEQVFPD